MLKAIRQKQQLTVVQEKKEWLATVTDGKLKLKQKIK
jgi:hypothetical protein